MSKSLLYAGNNSAITTEATGTTLPFNNIVRRYGCNINTSGCNVVVSGAGYYSGVVNVTYEGTEAGTVVFTVYKDGVAIPYANASATAVADTINAISIPFDVRLNCCCDSVISVVASGVSVSVTNNAVLVEKN